MDVMKKIFKILQDKKSKRIGLLVGILFLVFYLYSIGNIITVEMPDSFKFRVIDDWQDKVFKEIAPFLWEPIAVFYIYKGFSIFISIPNIAIALLLSVLVFLNISVAVYSYSLSRVCSVRPDFRGLLGFLPSFFTGFACCVPTFLIALGPALASFTLIFIDIRPFLIPASIILMVGSLIWSTKKIPLGYITEFEKKQ